MRYSCSQYRKPCPYSLLSLEAVVSFSAKMLEIVALHRPTTGGTGELQCAIEQESMTVKFDATGGSGELHGAI